MRARILSFIGWMLISLWSKSVRMEFVGIDIPLGLKADGKNFILAFWHGRQFLLFRPNSVFDIVIPASESRDGDVQARIIKRFGFDAVRGSSKRRGDRALLGLVDALRKGRNIALAVDGPRGPVYEVKQGVIYLAGKLDKVIIPMISGAKRRWILDKIWDKYLLPVPFTRGVVVYGEPVVVKGIGEEELESGRRRLADALNQAMKQADEHIFRS